MLRTIVLTVGIAAAGLNLSAQTITNGLIAWYPFDGNADDASGLGNHATVSGATLTTNRFGEADSAYYFNGGGERISATVPQLPLGTNARTLVAWINPNYSYVTWGLIHQGTGDCTGKMFGLSRQGTGQMGMWGGCQDWSASLYTTNNVWSFVAMTYENGAVTIYLNTNAQSQIVGSLATTASKLWIGAETINNGTSFRSFYKGIIDDVRFYNRALSAEEIQTLYNLDLQPELEIVKAVTVDCRRLTVGATYQFQVSTDTVNWTNWGEPFVATSSSYTNPVYEKVEGWSNRLFRLIKP